MEPLSICMKFVQLFLEKIPKVAISNQVRYLQDKDD